MARRIRLKWCTDLVLDGCGDRLTVTFAGRLQRRRAAEQQVQVTLELTRCAVRAALTQIGEMHKRDRARVCEELARIDRERKQLEKE